LLNQFNIHPGDMISLAEANDRFQALRQLDPHVMISSSIDGDRMLSIRLSAASATPNPEGSTRVIVKRIDASALPEPLRTEVLSRLGLHEGDSPSSGEINVQLAAACALDEHVDTTAFYLAGVSPQVEITFIYIPEGRRGQTLETWSQHPPAVIHMVPPVYPPLAMQARVQGTVRFLVTIQPDGSISNIGLVAGHPLLVPAATEAMKQYRFEVKPSESKATMDINFVLPH
jgi:TonB family protein